MLGLGGVLDLILWLLLPFSSSSSPKETADEAQGLPIMAEVTELIEGVAGMAVLRIRCLLLLLSP